MQGIEERKWNKPLDRLREDGKMGSGDWTLTNKERDALKNVIYAIYDIGEITIYYSSLLLVLCWMENKNHLQSCVTQRINLHFPCYFAIQTFTCKCVSAHLPPAEAFKVTHFFSILLRLKG